jgi:hypothetical protein
MGAFIVGNFIDSDRDGEARGLDPEDCSGQDHRLGREYASS